MLDLTLTNVSLMLLASAGAGLVDAIVGGGGLIIVPSLFGLFPNAVPATLLGTNKAASIWKKWSGYHRRSLVETKMHCFKRLGERVMARTFERQVVELHVRVALLNRFTQIGHPTTVAVPAMA
jgi:hypothetical protein